MRMPASRPGTLGCCCETPSSLTYPVADVALTGVATGLACDGAAATGLPCEVVDIGTRIGCGVTRAGAGPCGPVPNCVFGDVVGGCGVPMGADGRGVATGADGRGITGAEGRTF